MEKRVEGMFLIFLPHSIGRTITCVDPSKDEFDRIKIDLLNNSWRIWMSEVEHGDSYQIKEKILGDTQCPALKRVFRKEDSIALCPSYQVQEEDHLRIPSNLTQVRCRCDKCISKKIGKKSSCTPVYRLIPVLRRVGCRNGVNVYENSWERLSVACICKLHKRQIAKSKTKSRPSKMSFRRKDQPRPSKMN